MKEFVLTQPYNSLEEMLNSGEVAVYKEELEQGNIEKYAIVSRIGNRYDLHGKKIDGYAENPYFKKKEKNVVKNANTKIVKEDIVKEKDDMKYSEIEMFIDKEVDKAVEKVIEKHAKELAELNEKHAQELANAKYEAKAELLAKINS